MEKNNVSAPENWRQKLMQEYLALRPKIIDGTATEQEKVEFRTKKMMAHSYYGAYGVEKYQEL